MTRSTSTCSSHSDACCSSEAGSTLADECFAYDDVLRERGHFVGGEGLQSARKTTTLRYRNGEVHVTDGPFTEAKEQVGGVLFLEAKDL